MILVYKTKSNNTIVRASFPYSSDFRDRYLFEGLEYFNKFKDVKEIKLCDLPEKSEASIIYYHKEIL